MKLYTSYFAKLNRLPKNIIPVSICGKAPAFYTGFQYKKLAPKYGFFSKWKETHDNDFYIEHFDKEVLAVLNCDTVYRELERLSCGRDVALICYEKPGDFCHRHLVSEWFKNNGYECEEIQL